MGTRAAAFTAKIRSLYDYQIRLMQGVMPPPSGVDIANTMKYFSQTLLTVLKDVPNSPLELLKNPEMDVVRMGLFPSLDYKGLYSTIIPLIEVAPLIQYGLHAFGQATLQCLGCLLPFLDRDLIDNLPYLTASSIAVLPNTLHQDIINTLCFHILPFTLARHHTQDPDICQSVSAIMMMIFQYSTNPAHHCQLLECLMALKQNVLKDILTVIGHGTSAARASATKLLFYYWPTFNANLFDRKNLICKFAGDPTPFLCQRDMCPNAGNAEAAKVCYDHSISIAFANDTPPPLYLCIECANEIHREHPEQLFFDILHPMQQVSMICENKNCRSTDKSAVSICFSTECASYNGNHPIRYCEQCHNNRHNNRRGGDHIFHRSIPPTWNMDPEMQTYMVEAIVSLLKEAKLPTVEEPNKDNSEMKIVTTPAIDNITIEEGQLLGRYGVWLLVGRCTPTEKTPSEVLGRLLAMLFHWFHMTAYTYDGQEESNLEKLKTDIVCDWLRDISETHYNLFVSCLLPYPPEYARIGGHWNTLASRTLHLKDGLNRLFCLVPYEVITQKIWDYIMPHWMEAVVNDVPERELSELRIILSKILDADMGPLGFDAKKMYQFVAFRFQKNGSKVQEQALRWLQALTMLEIIIPLHLLFTIFGEGVACMKGEFDEKHDIDTRSKFISSVIDDCDSVDTFSDDDNRLSQQGDAAEQPDDSHNLICCIIMLDVLLKQMELQDIDKHTGLNSSLSKDVCCLLKNMLTGTWNANHTCSSKSECSYCESSIIWHQLSLQLVKYLSPVHLAHPPDPPIEEVLDDLSKKSPPESDKKEKSEVVLNMPIPEVHSVGGVLVHMPHVCSIMTATVEAVSEQLDLAAIIPAEKVVSAVARAITLSDTDLAASTTTANTAKNPLIIGENDENTDTESADGTDDNLWQTSVGKFRFNVDDLPLSLQYILKLLEELPKIDKPDVLYYILQCLTILILHGDACTNASKGHRGFFIWCQENLLIKNLWELCDSEHSHICQEVVPLLLHCITLPVGSDVFWRVIQDAFHCNDWCIRSLAVERVTIIARFMDTSPLRNILPLQAALANAFCYLISSMDDSNVYVSQKATLSLGTIHDFAIKSLIMCLETQFDTVIVDRPMVLQCLYQLHNSLSERKILTWDFFLNRFDTLFLESQITLENTGEISYLRDLRNSDLNSDVFLRKLNRAQEALSQSNGSATSSVKTLSASFGVKWPYKRTMSAPASILPRHESKEIRERIYNRQYSAPILKRKSSRFGLDGQHMHSLNMADDQNCINFLQKVVDLEEADKETIHLLVFLLMQFLSRSDQAYPAEEKNMVKVQGIVLKHFYLLLGYNQNDRGLYLPPLRLRSSPTFSVFLSNLPQLLDQNHLMGRSMIPTCLVLLQYAPSPCYIANAMDFQQPKYSLWNLESHLRKNWLMALVVLLYKYQYNQQPYSMHLTYLIKIVLNTLDAENHHCRRIPTTIMLGAPSCRSRDVSQPSLGTENDHQEKATPPLSPMFSESVPSKGSKVAQPASTNKPSSAASMETHWEEAHCIQPENLWKEVLIPKCTDSSIEGDDSESELMAIPESDLSDCTLRGSIQDSLDDVIGEPSPKRFANMDNKSGNKNEDALLTQLVGKNKRPTWFIGSEEESVKDLKKQMESTLSSDAAINSPIHLFNSQVNNKIFSMYDTTTSKHSFMGKNKKIIEPSLTPVCTPVSDYCDDPFKNEHSSQIPIPSTERLLPIGDLRSMDNKENSMRLFDSQLEMPIQERLLPIGEHNKDMSLLVDKVRHAIGIKTHLTKAEMKKAAIQDIIAHSSSSPRRLIKQAALESPSNQEEVDEDTCCLYNKTNKIDNERELYNHQRQGIRKSAYFTMGSYSVQDPRKPGAWFSPQLSPKLIEGGDIKQNLFKMKDEPIEEHCSECGIIKEEYSDEEIGLCIVILGTFIHREPVLAAPLLPDILNTVARIATNTMYLWQSESNIHLPGGAVSVAHQFLRCVLHQLAPNGIFTQMFQTNATDAARSQFFKSVIQSLTDFNELNPIAPLQLLLETLNSKKCLPLELPIILQNIACYLNCLPLEAALGPNTPIWSTVLQQLETLFRRILFLLSSLEDVTPLLKIMVLVFKIPLVSQFKGILEPFSKVLSFAIQNNILKYQCLMEIAYLCNRAFTKERDKLILSRTMVYELVQILKFKTTIPDTNLLILINLVLQDVGGSVASNILIKDCPTLLMDCACVTTGISECMRMHLGDILEFLTDFHTVSKMKSYCKGINVGLNGDTLGGIIKCSMAQYLALEISKGNGRDNRAVTRYFPWLYNTTTVQQSSREFLECIGHIRLLSWLILGSLTYTALHGNHSSYISQPIPQEASCQVADHIQTVISGFGEQPKTSVLHMSSLFHTFILCQLWTVYLEHSPNMHNMPATEASNVTMNILFEFWGKITPCILELIQQSKMLSEIVSLHFLSMLEALLECQSTFVAKLLPLWTPILHSNNLQLPGHLQVRLQTCQNFPPIFCMENYADKVKTNKSNPVLLKWLQRLQFKMGQIELQSSTATQFYSL